MRPKRILSAVLLLWAFQVILLTVPKFAEAEDTLWTNPPLYTLVTASDTTGTTIDCAGVLNGSALLDSCNQCVEGTTGKTACTKDCAGTWGGTALLDGCNQCVEGTTGKTACTKAVSYTHLTLPTNREV